MKKRLVISLGLILMMVFSLVGCGGSSLTSKNFSITVDSIEGNKKMHKVNVEFEKTSMEKKYFLYQNGEEIANGNIGKDDKALEFILENKVAGKIDYKLKVVAGDDELIKESVYNGSSDSSSKTETGTTTDKDDQKTTTNSDDQKSTLTTNEVETENNQEQNTSGSTSDSLGEWSFNSKDYKKGDKVALEGVNYECINDHTSQAGWSPKDAASLWKKIE